MRLSGTLPQDPKSFHRTAYTAETMRVVRWLTNSLVIAASIALLAAADLLCFGYPRFTYPGLTLLWLIVLLLVFDLAFILRDLWKPATRSRALLAIPLSWMPSLFLFSMMLQWEGPLYVAVQPGTPAKFRIRGASGFCGLGIYGPDHDQREWQSDEVGLLWSLNWPGGSGAFPMLSEFAYGRVPSGFNQTSPGNNASPPPLDPALNYTLEVDRCMGGPQYFLLRGFSVTDSRSSEGICWGELELPERADPARVRVDCHTRQPLPMSERAKERLRAYREKRIVYY